MPIDLIWFFESQVIVVALNSFCVVAAVAIPIPSTAPKLQICFELKLMLNCTGSGFVLAPKPLTVPCLRTT